MRNKRSTSRKIAQLDLLILYVWETVSPCNAKTPGSGGRSRWQGADMRKAGTMLRTDRMAAILEYVAANGSVDVMTAARELNVSAATLRRDLRVLQEQGLLLRTHGGAVANGGGGER